jgi:1-pyrroline-5-carboxylate dehydrogenase
MTTTPAPRIKITYSTLRNDNEELHGLYDAGVEESKAALGGRHQNLIGGRWVDGSAGTFETRSPIDQDILLGTFAKGGREDVQAAIDAARQASPGWRKTPWQDRLEILRRAAELISERQMKYGADMAVEVGKSRLEALGEVEEAADLIRYYAKTMEDNNGYDHPMDNLGDVGVHTRTILRPFGVFAVISPFNFPMALAVGPISAALMAGNTVVFKPATVTSLSGVNLVKAFEEAGLPAGVLNLVMGPGDTVGEELQTNPGIDGIVFTGSYEVGFRLFKSFSTTWPRPCIVEMGGKNPAIVMDSADLERAALGVYRSAFGMNGHKCSACSRLYVHEAVADDLLARLDEKLGQAVIGDPLQRQTFLGPVATRASFEDFKRYVGIAGGKVRTGGEVLADGARAHGYFVQPAILDGLPRDHQLMRDELFVPILAVQRVKSVDEAIQEANDTRFGLTAGIFTQKQAEIDAFLDRIEAGVVYVNRAAGATTGAWPGVQPFGGWKGSGSTGKNIGGHYTLPLYLREQSRTVSS